MATMTEAGELNIKYGGKLFKKPECKYQFAAEYPEGDDVETTTMLKAAYDKLWRKRFDKLKAERAKQIQVAMEKTEKEIAKKDKTEKELNVFIETANKLIKNGIDSWQKVEVPRLAQQVAEECYQWLMKKLKREVTMKKIRVGLKITALVLIVLAVAAATIALSVATAGAGTAAILGVVAGGIVTGGAALYKSYKVVEKEAKSYDDYLGKIEADLKKIDDAYAYQMKKQKKVADGGKLGPKEKIKLLMGSVGPHMKSLDKHITAATKQNVLLKAEAKKGMAKLIEAEENLRKVEAKDIGSAGKDLELARQARYQAGRANEKLWEKLGKFEDAKKAVNEAVSKYESKGEWMGSQKATGVLKYVQDHQETVGQVVTNLATLAKLGKKLMDAAKAPA